jgi:hypothetical protein
MWEAIGEVFTSSNGPTTGNLIVIIIALVVIAVRFGHLRIKSEHVAIGSGAQEKERTIIRNQTEWLRDAVYAYENQIPGQGSKGYNKYRGKYILSICYAEMVEWILYNHVEESNHYVAIKQRKLWNIILQNVENDEIRTEDFKDVVYDGVKDIIHNLVIIRKNYK